MKVTSADFIMSNSEWKKCPKPTLPEYAFIGRSNVGKSSLINALTNQTKLAKVSGKPGKTQLINHFLINESWYLVDLPGYGYAKVNEEMRDAWAKLLERYLSERKSLQGIFLIMDIRHPMGKFDQMMLEYCQTCNLPVHILLNKSDKISKNAANKVMFSMKPELTEIDASIQLFSALKGTGIDEARDKLAGWLFPDSLSV